MDKYHDSYRSGLMASNMPGVGLPYNQADVDAKIDTALADEQGREMTAAEWNAANPSVPVPMSPWIDHGPTIAIGLVLFVLALALIF